MAIFEAGYGGWLVVGTGASIAGFALVLIGMLRQVQSERRAGGVQRARQGFDTMATGLLIVFAGLPFQIVGTMLAVAPAQEVQPLRFAQFMADAGRYCPAGPGLADDLSGPGRDGFLRLS